eukprot:5583767-Amphidinium_carterae.2
MSSTYFLTKAHFNTLPHFNLSPRTTQRLDSKNLKHAHCMAAARQEATRGCDPITNSTLNQDALLSTVHVKDNI